jgi:glucose 1-dehydrogenase
MRAVGVVPTKREVRLIEHQRPEVSGPTDVLVRTLDVGICGTDREICTFVYGSPPQGFEYLVLGHESLGEVVEVGDAVESLKPGDLVVPSVRRPCPHAHCRPCRNDQQDYCATGDFVERGIKMVHGYMTESYVDEAKFMNYVPQDLRDVAVLTEPLTIAEKALQQVWQVQGRIPWSRTEPGTPPGRGLNAVVLGAGPIGILGTMALLARGFKTVVYSRSQAPNPKAELVESLGAEYISALDTTAEELAARVGNIDLVYEAVGGSEIAFNVIRVLGVNGVFVFTGIPAPGKIIDIHGDLTMRNIVLMNQAIIGTVNADRAAFQSAITDLGVFKERWPDQLNSIITGRFSPDDYHELLVGKNKGIKNVIRFAS